eukprot:SM000139S00100  [mRNA]  locus=s139:106595:117233:+ [translate_table: standard]
MAGQESAPLLSTEDTRLYAGEKEPEAKAAPENPPPMQTPAMAPTPVPMDRQLWSTGLFECWGRGDGFDSSDCEVCALGTFAPCILYGSNMERLHPNESGSFFNNCWAYCGLFVIGKLLMKGNFLAPCLSFPLRTELRSKYNLQGQAEQIHQSSGCCGSWIAEASDRESCEAVCDCCVHYFCHPCALCQEGREIRRRIPATSGPAVVAAPLSAPQQQIMTAGKQPLATGGRLAMAPHLAAREAGGAAAAPVDHDAVLDGLRARRVDARGGGRDGGAKSPVEAAGDGGLRAFSSAEVARHASPRDCWLIVRGYVYDVTAWSVVPLNILLVYVNYSVPRHPGGSLIYVKAGGSLRCLLLIDDSSLEVSKTKLLDRYCIGRVDSQGDKDATSRLLRYSEDDGARDFYTTLKRRVEAYFQEQKVDPRSHPHMFMKTFLICAGYILCYFATFFYFQNTLLMLSAALGMGVLAAEVGVSIQHDANHGAYSRWTNLGFLMSTSLDLVGASSFMWRQQHVVGHHVSTNVNEFDPDIRVKDPDVRRVTIAQPWQWYHAYQKYYLGALYGLLAIKSIFVDDFSAYFSGKIGSVQVAKMTTIEEIIFFGGKAAYATYMFVIPSLFGVHGQFTNFSLFLLSQLMTGWILAFMFQVAHVVDEAEFYNPSNAGRLATIPRGWAAAQVATTTDFSHGSFFWTHFSGGLNYQIEHHLFPAMCHVRYPSIQPIVQRACEEFNVPYHCFQSFWSALQSHFAYLEKAGRITLAMATEGVFLKAVASFSYSGTSFLQCPHLHPRAARGQRHTKHRLHSTTAPSTRFGEHS